MNKVFKERPNDGGSYSYDPETGLYTQLEPTTAHPEGKSARAAREAAEADAAKAAASKVVRRGIKNTTDEE